MSSPIHDAGDNLSFSIFKLKSLADLVSLIEAKNAYEDTPGGISFLFIDELERMDAQVSLLFKHRCECDAQIERSEG